MNDLLTLGDKAQNRCKSAKPLTKEKTKNRRTSEKPNPENLN
jgi:hypothetical protein